MDNKFTKQVYLYKRDEKGNYELDESKQKILEREIGTFIFRRPSVRDEIDMRVERTKLLQGLKLEEVDDLTKLYIEYCVYFPRLCVEAPANWDWDYTEPLIMLAVSEAFAEGYAEIG